MGVGLSYFIKCKSCESEHLWYLLLSSLDNAVLEGLKYNPLSQNDREKILNEMYILLIEIIIRFNFLFYLNKSDSRTVNKWQKNTVQLYLACLELNTDFLNFWKKTDV